MSGREFDVGIVGGGVNALVAALVLARDGRRVTVLEGSERLGGLARGDEFHDGFTSLGALVDTRAFRRRLAEDLDLARHGLEWQEGPDSGVYLGPEGRRRALNDPDAAGDGDGAGDWRLKDAAPALAALLDKAPPPIDPSGAGDVVSLALQGLRLRMLGRKTLLRTLRALPMPAADWLREAGLGEIEATALCVPALLGTFLGPHSAGSAACVLFREAVRGRAVRGGAPALVGALEAACRSAGVEVRTGVGVSGITVRDGRAVAVTLATGERLAVDRVLATCDPRRTMLDLLDPSVLEVGLRRRLRAYRCRGTAATLDLALSEPLTVDGVAPGTLRLGPATLDGLERAFDPVKYGEASAEPVMELSQEVLADGRAVVSGLVGWVPAAGGASGVEGAGGLSGRLPGRSGDGPGPVPGSRGGRERASAHGAGEGDQALAARALDLLEKRLPGSRERVVAWRLRTPRDLEADFGLTGGHLHHGEHALDQLLFMRPTPELARYRTPVRGLYLGGGGSHPGGGVTGMPGRLAAEALLSDEG